MSARAILFLPGTFTPALVALGLAARDGDASRTALVGRMFVWRVPLRFYFFAVSYIAIIKLTAAILHRGLTGTWPGFGDVPVYLLLLAVLFSTPTQAGEELGWRGHLLPRLTRANGLAAASVITGMVWALWHLPLFLLPATDLTGQSFPVFFVAVTALGIAMGWLHDRTGGSLLLVMLMHSAINNTTGIVPAGEVAKTHVLVPSASLVGWLTTGILVLGGFIFLLRMRQFPQAGKEKPRTGVVAAPQ